MSKLFPSGYFIEFKAIHKLAWPIILTQFFQMMLGPESVMFSGHLGKTELDAVALAISIINVMGLSIGTGLATACDTLFAQIYGSKHKKYMGVVLQKSIIILTLACFLCMIVHINAAKILIYIGQDPHVSYLTGDYLLFFLPGLMAYFINSCLIRYIMAQNKVAPCLIISFIANIFNIGVNFLLIYKFNLSIRGSAIAQSSSYILSCLLTLAYIKVSGFYKDTWDGFKINVFTDWYSFIRLAIPGMVMVCLEWWSFEVGVVLSGLLGTTELAAQAVAFQLEAIFFTFPYGFSIATSIRVGQNLGKQNIDDSRTTANVSLTIVGFLSIIYALIFSLARFKLPIIFTNSQDVIDMAASIFPIIAAYMFFDSINVTSLGILRGCGRQSIGCLVVFFGYGVAMSVGISLMFKTNLKLVGLWIGLAIGLTICGLINLTIVIFTNWKRQIELAIERISQAKPNEETEPLLHFNSKENNQFINVESIPKKLIVQKCLIVFVCVALLLLSIFVRIFL